MRHPLSAPAPRRRRAASPARALLLAALLLGALPLGGLPLGGLPLGDGHRGLARAEDRPPASPPPVRVEVEGRGFVRVTAASLRTLGYADEQHVTVRRRGQPVPVHTSRTGDGVVFLALSADGSARERRTYVLEPDPAPRAAPAGPAPEARPRPSPGSATTRPQVRRAALPARLFSEQPAAEAEVYDVAAPTWYVALIARGGSLSVSLPADAPPGSSQRLVLRVHGNHPGEVALAATHAGRDLGVRAALRTQGGAEFAWDLVDVAAGEPVVLSDRSRVPAPPPSDVSEGRGDVAVASVAWEGVAEPTVGAALVSWPVRPEPYAFRGASEDAPPLLLCAGPDGSACGRPTARWIAPGWVVEDGPAAAGARVWAASAAQEVEARPIPPRPDPLAAAAGAEHVIVSTTALLQEAQRLAAHRTAHGLASVAVAAQDLYEAFSEGERDPEAIRAFLLRLREPRDGPALRYVLLLGDALRDRADLGGFETIPVRLARTIYNGATPADSLYVERDGERGLGAPAVGRLPFRAPAEAQAFVSRLIAYETAPPADASRRRIQFLANEARFGPLVDRLIESFFRGVVTRTVPPEMEVELTFASAGSPYLWPPREFGSKVLSDINRGALFYTYVGHGFAQGFDSLQIGAERYPVLHLADVPQVAITGTPPVLFAVACTTAEFDHEARTGLGEALLARPDGPIAYLGATRICHPAGNVFLGRSMARALFREGTAGARRLGDVLRAARDEVLDPSRDDRTELALVTAGALVALPPGSSLERLKREALWLYNLLGDPGTRLALPDAALEVAAEREGEALVVRVRGAPEGAEVEVTLELPRARMHPDRPIAAGLRPLERAAAEAIRANHAHANDKVLRRGRGRVEQGVLVLRLEAAPGERALSDPAYGGGFHLNALCVSADRVALGTLFVNLAQGSPDGPPGTR